MTAELKPFTKIFALGTPYVRSIFDQEVEITEKVDGSQFVFGNISGQLLMRSKGAQIFVGQPNAMFSHGINYVQDLFIAGRLPENVVFYGEYLQKPKHNALTYGRVPTNHIALYGMSNPGTEGPGARAFHSHTDLVHWANRLDIDAVPLIYQGNIDKSDEIIELLDRESYLGGPKIEGVVVKNHVKRFLDVGNQPCSMMVGKFVSEAFKEVHKSNWKGDHTSRGKWDLFKDQYRTDARWEKAVQHLRDDGRLTETPKDIGQLIKEVRDDITAECKLEIQDFLWKEFGDELLRMAINGLPEWYKERLMATAMDVAA